MAETPIVPDKISYLKRIRDLFRRRKPEPETGVPRAFHEVVKQDLRFAMPDRVLPIFQKMIFSVKDLNARVAIMDSLINMTSKKAEGTDVDYERDQLCFQIFEGVTGHFYGEPPHVDGMAHHNIQETDFFRLVYIGIRSYECVSPEKREKFNRAIMSGVKKRGIVVPYRLQQYQR